MRRLFVLMVVSAMVVVLVSPAFALQPFPDTGQTKCYDHYHEIACPAPGEPFYGQDAQYQPRIPRSYTKLGMNGVELPDDALHTDQGGEWMMTRDNVTGLIWEIKSNSNKEDEYNWQDAQDVFVAGLNSAGFGGFSDWRLPTIQELLSLINSGVFNPAKDAFWFPNTMIELMWFGFPRYWASTTHAYYIGLAWAVDFRSGTDSYGDKTSSRYMYVRAVRGEQSGSFDDYIINGDGTVTDPKTGLMWQEETAFDEYTWQDALAYIENLTLADYTDWRLPNINELKTLVDYSKHDPAVNGALVETTVAGSYWSSTTGDPSSNSLVVDFSHDNDYYGSGHGHNKTDTYYVRAVRGGQSSIGSFGNLVISIEPAEVRNAGAQWRRSGNSTWRDSGAMESGMPTDTYTIEFKDIDGWNTPANITVTVNINETTTATGTYTKILPTGSMLISIEPAEARAAGAQWRRKGTATWFNSGDTESNVPTGTHTIEFKTVPGWKPIARITVNVQANTTATGGGTYVEHTGTSLPGVLMLLLDEEE